MKRVPPIRASRPNRRRQQMTTTTTPRALNQAATAFWKTVRYSDAGVPSAPPTPPTPAPPIWDRYGARFQPPPVWPQPV